MASAGRAFQAKRIRESGLQRSEVIQISESRYRSIFGRAFATMHLRKRLITAEGRYQLELAASW
jgi:hypothetical protein